MTTATSEQKRIEPWPYAIIGVFIIFAGLIVTAGVIMSSQEIHLVADDYYAQEIAFQGQIDRQMAATENDKVPDISYRSTEKLIQLIFPNVNQELTEGTITLFRPSNAREDKVIQIDTDASGIQYLDASQLSEGPWTVKVDWKEGAGAYYAEGKVMVGDVSKENENN